MRRHYSDAELWKKLAAVARKAGVKTVYAVLLLYFVATDSKTPTADKAKIFGALGYFILPVDLIPDLTPIVGYTDDMVWLVWALKAVWKNVTPELEMKAKRQLEKWFGNVDELELKIL